MDLRRKIADKTVKVAVIGLGYVGLPIAVEFAKAGLETTGIDLDLERVGKINRGESYILDVKGEDVVSLSQNGKLRATSDYSVLKGIDVIFICVPTPFTKAKDPDISYIVAATEGIARYLHPGQLIVLQSTTYPGTTEEVVLPLLESTGLKAGRDFYLAFSPERIDPGNRTYGVKNTPKVVGGITPEDTELACDLFELIIERKYIHSVSTPKAAEMTKLLENIYRSVNIALVNELTKLCDRMGLDIWEVIDAASTKPFGFMPFYPGPGVGGHCIPVDPYYLSWKAREYDFYTKFVELAAEVNQSMPFYTVSKVTQALNQQGKTIKGSQILILGVAFKRDIDDPRNSPSLDLIKILSSRGAQVFYNDPYVPKIELQSPFLYNQPVPANYTSLELTEDLLARMDCVVIAVKHSLYDFPWIVKYSPLIVDAQNATKGIVEGREKIFKL